MFMAGIPDDLVFTHDGVPLLGPGVDVAGPLRLHQQVFPILGPHAVRHAAVTLPRVAHH